MIPNLQQLLSFIQSQKNPMYQNLAKMIQEHDEEGLKALARNLAESQGKDFDKEFASFKSRFGFH